MILSTQHDLDALDFQRSGGLVTVVAQNADTGDVLMVAHASRQALENTLRDGVLWFYSRSRSELWRKGDTSGNIMRVVSLHADCDADAILALVSPAGPACHTGADTCFSARPTLSQLASTIAERATNAAEGSYTAKLLSNANLRAKKLGEEAVELALACRSGDTAEIANEGADLLYHLLAACQAGNVTLADIAEVLRRRSDGASPAEKKTINNE